MRSRLPCIPVFTLSLPLLFPAPCSHGCPHLLTRTPALLLTQMPAILLTRMPATRTPSSCYLFPTPLSSPRSVTLRLL
ncbi:hypothetical protein DFH29DRAFT_967980 [Suillus ampliporus]|nr:hypothetical protein DFH29DRAFT_967980 [Suillus ampliporus]